MNRLTITHDGPLDIATGRSRKELKWKNKETQWSELVNKLATTHATAETHAEYLAAKKPRQDEIKDIGGFVGGYLTSGRRKSGSVLHRQLVTLDADFVTGDIWDDFLLQYGTAAVIYSTHKHSPDKQRLRLIIPLDRKVTTEEYQAIARKIAGVLNINQFDHTTFQPERLMYWPSTSSDGEYVFKYCDAPWLSADEILGSYHNWQDTSEWPTATSENEFVERQKKKQGDPLDKKNIIGAWCRTYTIHEVIDNFLSDEYEATDHPGRYTYKQGSTAAGLVVYEDKFAFSHHGTDPTSGKLCNAFDLVRLHKFGLKDEDTKQGTAHNKLPSYLAMCDFVNADPKAKIQIGEDIINSATDDFDDDADDVNDGVDDKSWMAKLEIDRRKQYYPTINNLVLMLENDPAFKDNICYDEFEQIAIARRDFPWRKITAATRYLTDQDDDNIEHYLEKKYKIACTKLDRAMSVVYAKHCFHPVRDYLNSLKWDKKKRVDKLLTEYMGAEDNNYTRAVIRKSLSAAVARVFNPGVKFDYVLTLVGKEGQGKSALFDKLGRGWFSDTFNMHMLQSKEGYEQLRGVWIIEISELSGMAKAEVERVKGFIAARSDRYRRSYGKRSENFQRQCIFFATTNKVDFLRSQTGNRRFWPVAVDVSLATKNVFKDLTEKEINQVWAEAVELYKKGEQLYLPVEIEQLAIDTQKDHTEEHPWAGVIEVYLEKLLPEGWNKLNRYERQNYLHDEDELKEKGAIERDRVCVLEIWIEALNKRETIGEYEASIVRHIMRNMRGWKEIFEPIRYSIYGLQRKGFLREKTGVTNHVTNQ